MYLNPTDYNVTIFPCFTEEVTVVIMLKTVVSISGTRKAEEAIVCGLHRFSLICLYPVMLVGCRKDHWTHRGLYFAYFVIK